ncbi:hypothetical protein DPMN_083058 [Dreissena polymorpha]|uniref:Uncharacterized protein n=1 Tax=Dreissena polymorpha TaxID=45954 RepID=A0A9D4BAR1_DREPO|nr:hypothetical protein DPMN_083058 [Dreissena polymorpha]
MKRIVSIVAQERYKIERLTLQISVSNDCSRRVVQTSLTGCDTRVVRTKSSGDLRDVLN